MNRLSPRAGGGGEFTGQNESPLVAVTIDEEKKVWVATKKGVYLLDPAGTLVELDVAARLRTE